MIVMKFGGTSVQDATAIRRVGEIIKSRKDHHPIVVVSAMGKVTDDLVSVGRLAADKKRSDVLDLIAKIIQRHERIITDLGLEDKNLKKVLQSTEAELLKVCEKLQSAGHQAPHLLDRLLSTGEYLSANILSAYLNTIELDSVMFDARDVVVTDSQFGRALPLFKESEEKAKKDLLPLIEEGKIPVTQGFVGMDTYGRTTTLGRGGSDYTATFLGSLIQVERVEIWSDVDGVLTADPTIVPDAKRIKLMSFQEAAELAYFGAKVLHPNMLLPAIEHNIPVYVLNSTRPGDEGTCITSNQNGRKHSASIVKSIAYKEGLTVITVTSTRMLMAHGFLATIFDIFNRYQTSVDLVSTSEVSVSVTIDNTDNLEDICRELRRFAQVDVQQDKAIVCLVGEGMKHTPGMPTKIFCVLEDIPIHLISQGASEINISFVIDQKQIEKVVTRLHQKFFSRDLDKDVFAE